MISHAARFAYCCAMIRILALLLALQALPLLADGPEGITTAQLRPGWLTPQGRQMAALDIGLQPGWKTYWRAPGEAGIPPVFDWTGSQNLGAVRILWPSPDVFDLNGMRTIGYHDRLVLPLELTPKIAGEPIRLKMRVDLGLCKDICIPATLEMDSVLEGQGAPDPAISAALQARPMTGSEAGLDAIGCKVEPTVDGLRLTATLDLPALGTPEAVVIESNDPTLWVSQANSRRDGHTMVAAVDLVGATGTPFALDRSGVTVTVIASQRSVEVLGCPGG